MMLRQCCEWAASSCPFVEWTLAWLLVWKKRWLREQEILPPQIIGGRRSEGVNY